MNGPVTFHTSRTDLQFIRLEGELEITPNADLTANQLTGPVILNTRNRNITLDRVSGPLNITNRNGSVTATIAPPMAPITIENRNGDVELTLPTTATFNVQAETTNADLENDFGLSNTQDGDHPKLVGSIGSGGPLVQITTSQADISIHKGSVSPLSLRQPAPSAPLTAIPAGARESLREAQRALAAAQQEAAQESRQAQKDAQAGAEEARKQALASATQARKEAQSATEQAQKDARQAAEQARTHAREAAKQARDEASSSN